MYTVPVCDHDATATLDSVAVTDASAATSHLLPIDELIASYHITTRQLDESIIV